MHKLFISLITILFLIGCDGLSEDLPISSHEQDMRMQQLEYAEMEAIAAHPQRSVEDVVKIATDVFLQDHPSTRAAQLCRDIKVDVLSFGDAQPTRGTSTGGDSSIFVCNLGDKDGFVLVSGDRRVPEMLAYVPEGSFHLDSIGDNHPLLPFLDRLPSYFSESKAKFEKKRKAIGRSHAPKEKNLKKELEPWWSTEPTSLRIGPWEDQATPVKSLVLYTWDQEFPYNTSAPVVDGNYAMAGCMAVAVSQFVAYHKYPTNIRDSEINWRLISQCKKADSRYNIGIGEVAGLIRRVGDGLNNKWGKKNTDAILERIPELLLEWGYHVPQNAIVDYNENDVIASLKQFWPVLMYACSTKNTYHTGVWPFRKEHTYYSGGHVWIIDGYLPQIRVTKMVNNKDNTIIYSQTERRLLVHCNWGWGGYYNGFFLAGVFSATRSEKPDILSTRSTPEERHNYRYEFKIIPYVHP
jgi:hypothetical protein